MVVSPWSSNLYEGADIRLKSDAEAADAAAGSGEGQNGAPAGDAQGAGSKAPQGVPAAGGAQNGNAAPKAQ